MHASVIDTNVAIVANARETNASESCILACVGALRDIVERGVIVLDVGGEIFSEYRRHLRPSGQPGVGDMFMRWAFDHLYNEQRCERVVITPNNGSYDEFPKDVALSRFHRKDRKFIAVAKMSRLRPSILNAVDSDYAPHIGALARNGVEVKQLCSQRVPKQHRRSSH